MDQQPQSITKKPSKFSRFLRSIFGSCGGKSVEKTLVEDEKDGNRDYSFSFSSSGSDSDSAYSSKEKGSKNGKLQNEFQKVTDDIKEELQVADLKRKLTETTEELLEIQPRELKFIFELKKQSTCSVRLFNKSNNHVAFKVKTTAPKKKYSVRPNIGIIKPKSTCEFTVKMQAERVAPPDMICKDQFLVQSTVVPAGTSDDDITPSIFAKDDVRYVEENKLKVVLVSPPNSPVLSPINRTLKQVPAYEPSILKDQVLRKDESLTQRHTVTEDVESKVENSEEANSAKNLEYKTRKDADEPLMDVGYKTRKEVDEPTTDVEHETRMDVDEPITDVEHKTMNDMEELKLVKDVSEMKSKLNGLESKLSEDENAYQLRKKWNRDYSFSFSSSGSDSDSAYSSKEKGSKNGKLQNKFQKVTDDIKEELQVADLKRKLAETTEELLEIHPRELKFIFELKKQSTCSVRLFNKSNNHVAFKVKATSPKKYSVRPNRAIIKPKSTCEFTVKMQAQRVAPPDMICKDQFLVQSTVVPAGTSDDDITPSIFAKDDVRYVEENKLKVVLVSPPNSPVLSPINRTLKPVLAYEPSILKDQVLRKFESLTQRHTVTEDVESKVENSEEANSAKNLEYKTRKDADEPSMDVGYKTRKEVDEPTTDVEHKTRMDVDEPTTDVEHKTMNDMEELKLVKDVSEMKSKLNGLESKLSEAEVIISKLTEERRLNAQERESLWQELCFVDEQESCTKSLCPPFSMKNV
ncbi:unnamed protein product [Camellia sinensis]